MNCPKCNFTVKDSYLNCPKCNKVLKLKCPKCGSIGKSSVCSSCNHIILSKCFKCGKLNASEAKDCIRCGMSITASMALKEAQLDKFAVLSLEMENFSEIQQALENKEIGVQFKNNLLKLINNLANQSKVRVQEIENVLIIRFCKDANLKNSCSSAVDFAINVSQSITEINTKLIKLQKPALKVKMAISQGDLSNNTTTYAAGRKIKVFHYSEKAKHILDNIQILVDTIIYKETAEKYNYQALSSVYVKDKILTFYELMLDQILKLPEKKVEKSILHDLPEELDYVYIDQDNDTNLINFSEKQCSFIKVDFTNLRENITKIITSGIKNPIIAVKEIEKLGKLSVIDKKSYLSKFNNLGICSVCSSRDDKYKPYGLLRELFKAYFDISEYDILINQEELNKLPQHGLLRSILGLTPNNMNNPEAPKFEAYDLFAKFFSSIKNYTLFIIEDFENIDQSSLDIFKYLIENKKLGNSAFLLSCSDEFHLHREINKLINYNNYFELELKPTSNKNILTTYEKELKDIQNSFFFRKVIENMKGSNFYLQQALGYLVDNDIFKYENEKYSINQNQMLVVPKDIDELIKKRIETLSSDKKLYDLFVSMLMLGNETSLATLKLLNTDKLKNQLQALQNKGFIDITSRNQIKINNYNLFKNNLLLSIDDTALKQIIINLVDKVFLNLNAPHPVLAGCCEFLNSTKNAFSMWTKLSEVCLSNGDYLGYVNCCNKFLNLISNTIDESTENAVSELTLETYNQMSTTLYKYYPEKVLTYLESLLIDAEKTNDDKKVKNLSNIIIQSCLIMGKYSSAFDYAGKIISRTPKSSFDPASKEFSLKYYLINFVSIEIFYNLGRLEECIELGDEVLKHITSFDVKAISPEDFSQKTLKDALKDAQIFVCIAKMLHLNNTTEGQIKNLISEYSEDNNVFQVLFALNCLIKGDISTLSQNLSTLEQKIVDADKLSKILFLLLKTIILLRTHNWEDAANTAHKGRLIANEINAHQLTQFLDLMIGFSYKNIGNTKKANDIFYNILKISAERGLKTITYLCWYLIADLELYKGNIDKAFTLLNNSMNIENDPNASKLIIMMFKHLLAKVFIAKNELEKAVFCLNHALEIATKSALKEHIKFYSEIISGITAK